MIPETITYEEASERYHCDKRSIRRAVQSGAIHTYRPGRTVRLDRKMADEWFMSTVQNVPVIG